MAIDIVLDTHFLTNLIAQYYKNEVFRGGDFTEDLIFSSEVARYLNRILRVYQEEQTFSNGFVVASSFAFIEIVRQFEKTSNGSYSLIQFKAFIEAPPEWFVISDLDEALFEYFHRIPSYVSIGDEEKNIEWPDAVHCATALSRDQAILITFDERISNINLITCVS